MYIHNLIIFQLKNNFYGDFFTIFRIVNFTLLIDSCYS